MSGLVVTADTYSVVAHQEVKFEHELEDLVQCDLQAVVSCPCQETLLQNRVKVRVMESDKVFEEVDLS